MIPPLPDPSTLVGLTGDPALGTLPYVDPPPNAQKGAPWFGEPAWHSTVHEILRAWLAGPGGPRLEGRWEDLVAHTRAIEAPGSVHPIGDQAVALRYGRSCILWSHGRAMPYAAHGHNPLPDQVFAALAALAPVWEATSRAPWWCLTERPTGPWPHGGILPIWSPAFPHWTTGDHGVRMDLLLDVARATHLPEGDHLGLMAGTVGPRGALLPPQVLHSRAVTPKASRPLQMDALKALGGWERCFSCRPGLIAEICVPAAARTSAHAAVAIEAGREKARARLLPFLRLEHSMEPSWSIESLYAR